MFRIKQNLVARLLKSRNIHVWRAFQQSELPRIQRWRPVFCQGAFKVSVLDLRFTIFGRLPTPQSRFSYINILIALLERRLFVAIESRLCTSVA